MTNPPSLRRTQGFFQRVGTFVVNTKAVTLVVHTPDGNASEVRSEMTYRPSRSWVFESISKLVPHSHPRQDSNLDLRFWRPKFSPLNYVGMWPGASWGVLPTGVKLTC
jgi:hypothetical protein